MPEKRGALEQYDDDTKLAVSLYGKDAAAGDTPLVANSSGYQIVGLAAGGAAMTGITTGYIKFAGVDDTVRSYLVALGATYNGASVDVIHGNIELTLLASAARTSTTNSSDQTNYNAKGVVAFLDVTAVPGVDTVTLHIQVKDPVSGNYRTIASTAAYDTTGTRYLVCYPGATDTGNKADGKNDLPLPRTWRIQVAHSGTGSFTYSVGASLIL